MNDFLSKLNENSILSFFKEHLSLILIIPPIIGGSRQVFALVFFYDLSLLYYFSSTQVIIEAVLFFILLISLLFISSIVNIILSFFDENIKKTIHIFLILIILIIIIANIVNDFLFILCILLFGTAISLYSIYAKENKFFLKPFLIFIFTLGIAMPNFNNNDDVLNFSDLTSKMKKKHKNAKIIFINDKYIIYSLDENKNNYQAIKFEDSFQKMENEK